jgi:hypothetical protein
MHGIWCSKTRATNVSVSKTKYMGILNGGFWFGSGRWRLWHIETIDTE